MRTHHNMTDRDFLRLLKLSPFQQRPGGWRFGTKRISKEVVARLIASGGARMDGERLVAAEVGK
jgi:hypothetical protein